MKIRFQDLWKDKAGLVAIPAGSFATDRGLVLSGDSGKKAMEQFGPSIRQEAAQAIRREGLTPDGVTRYGFVPVRLPQGHQPGLGLLQTKGHYKEPPHYPTLQAALRVLRAWAEDHPNLQIYTPYLTPDQANRVNYQYDLLLLPDNVTVCRSNRALRRRGSNESNEK